MNSLNRIIDKLENVNQTGENCFTSRCPSHDDHKNSLSVRLSDDGACLIHCFAGCPTEDIIKKLGFTWADLFPTKKKEVKKIQGTANGMLGQLTAVYDYVDEAGKTLYEVCRYFPKDFRQRRPDGKGGWLYALGDVRRVLYDLPEVLKAVSDGQTVFVAEGEKDCNRLHLLGLCATTNAAGAAAKWIQDYSEALKGADVVLLPDNDAPGRKHMADVAKALVGYAASIKIVELPNLAEKQDVSNYLDAGNTVADLLDLVRATPIYTAISEKNASEKEVTGSVVQLENAIMRLTINLNDVSAREEAILAIAGIENGVERGQRIDLLANILKPTGVGKRDIRNEVTKHRDTSLQEQRTGDARKGGNDISNFVNVIEGDEKLKGLVYNTFTSDIEFNGEAPWSRVKSCWSGEDFSCLKHYLHVNYDLWEPGIIGDATTVAATRRAYHPVKNYLSNLKWDKTPRVDTLLIDYLEAEDTAYTRAVTRKTLVAAVARVFEPGIKFDQMLVLVGGQGIGKSTLFRQLGRQWFNDSLMLQDLQDKTGAEKLRGYWIMEIGELAGMRKVEAETVKNFLSRQSDVYRAAYGRNTEKHLRQSILVGTTNADMGFLTDRSGGRRFWPVVLTKKSTDVKYLRDEEIDQVWAEAKTLYSQGEKLLLEPEIAALAFAEQNRHREADEREGLVAEFLRRRLPSEWASMSISARQAWIQGDGIGRNVGTGRYDREEVCTLELWVELFGRRREDLNDRESRSLTNILRSLPDWELAQQKKKVPHYGSQRVFVKKAVKEQDSQYIRSFPTPILHDMQKDQSHGVNSLALKEALF